MRYWAIPLASRTIAPVALASWLCGLSLAAEPLLASSQYMLSNAVHAHQSPQLNLVSTLKRSSLPMIEEVTRLYEIRNFQLIWSNGLEYNQNAQELLETINQADNFGLNPFDYDIEFIRYFLEATNVHPPLLGRSDVALTHAYVKLAYHINSGKLRFSQTANVDNYSLLALLNDAVNNQTIGKAIDQLKPRQADFTRLASALKKYRGLERELEPLTLKKRSLAVNDRAPEIIELRKILHRLGDYQGTEFSSDLFDEELAAAVSIFQYRHGLEVDGVIGRHTLSEINKPITQRIQQLELNLEKARMLPENDHRLYVLINIPAYRLYVIENNNIIYQSRVIVGKKKHKTPVLSSEISEIVLNPYWNVPRSIAKNEIIPQLQKDPLYLKKNNIRLLGRLAEKTVVVNPQAIDWAAIDAEKTTLRFRQDPGTENSLGQIKFLFPNRHSVYLHDTPSRRLFSQRRRAFSHGCIRVENPFDLAEVLLTENGDLDKDELQYLTDQKKRKSIKFEQPVPIYTTYMTSWVDENGLTHFRSDIYGRDSQIAISLYNEKK